MTTLADVMEAYQAIAPLSLAESWDNVGLLLGDPNRQIRTLMTCLTLTESVLAEAIGEQVDLVIPHHPIPFKPVSSITTQTPTGSVLLKAAENRIAIYCAHTAWDNAERGINQQLADVLGLTGVAPLVPASPPLANSLGSGRFGELAIVSSVQEIRNLLEERIDGIKFRHTHSAGQLVRRIGIVCGSGGSCLDRAVKQGCDGFLTGEATYHQCLEAEAKGICLIQIGHHASEFFAMQRLARMLAAELPAVRSFCATRETSPF